MSRAEAPGTCWVEPSTPQRPSISKPDGLPTFHRGANAGFRCVRNVSPLPNDVLAERRQTIQDFSKAKPATDHEFRIYKTLYAYDPTPLNAKSELVSAGLGRMAQRESGHRCGLWKGEGAGISVPAGAGSPAVPDGDLFPDRPCARYSFKREPRRHALHRLPDSERARCRISGVQRHIRADCHAFCARHRRGSRDPDPGFERSGPVRSITSRPAQT